MTYQQQPPYPDAAGNPGAYHPYPDAQPYPGAPPSGPRTPPQPVVYAFYLMLAGAMLTLLSTLFSFTELSEAREATRRNSEGVLSEGQLDTLTNISFAGGIAVALISVGLWLWMAFVNRAGKNWARITATVFFGLYSASMLAAIAVLFLPDAVNSAISTTLDVLVWLVGLAATILLWNRQSSAYFTPAPSYPRYPGNYPAPPPYPGSPSGPLGG